MYKVADILVMVVVVVAVVDDILVSVVVDAIVVVVDVAFLSQYPIELDCSQLSSLSSSLSAASFLTFLALVDLLSSETLATFAAAGFESWASSLLLLSSSSSLSPFLRTFTFGSMGYCSCLMERLSLKTNPIFSIVSERKKQTPTLNGDPCRRLPFPAVSCKSLMFSNWAISRDVMYRPASLSQRASQAGGFLRH